MNKKTNLILLILAVVFILNGCHPINSLSITEEPFIPETLISPTKYNPTATGYLLPTEIRSTQTKTISTVPPTKTRLHSTQTVVPTLSETQEAELIIDMLIYGDGCKLPCWHNFIPGVTSWDSIYNYYSAFKNSFKLRIYHDNGKELIINSQVPNDRFSLGIRFAFDNNILKLIDLGAYISKGDNLIVNDPVYYKYMQHYTISELLLNYGKPHDVIVTAVLDSSGGAVADYEIILYYPNNGIMVSYSGLRNEADNIYRLCLNESFVRLLLWSPEDQMTIVELYLYGDEEVFIDNDNWYINTFRPLEEATGMDIEIFYKTFMDSKNHACLETSKKLWKQ